MRGVSAFVLAALAACSVSAQDTRETQPSAPTQVEEIYVVRSVPESSSAPTEFCAKERIGFDGATYEGRFAFQSTAIQASDGRMIDTNMRTVGSLHICRSRTTPDSYIWYGEGTLASTQFKGVGECHGGKPDFPEQGTGSTSCFLHLSGLPSQYVGGLLTTNTMWSLKGQGMETDPPGYTQASIATIRLWRKRDAPSAKTSDYSKPPAQLASPAEEEVASFERQIELAAAHRDLKFLEAAADDSLHYTHGDDWTMGGAPLAVNDKAAWLGWLGNPKTRMLSREVSEQHVELHGDVALTTGKIDIRTDSSDSKFGEYTIWYLRVYRRQDGRWRLLSHHTVREIFKTTDK